MLVICCIMGKAVGSTGGPVHWTLLKYSWVCHLSLAMCGGVWPLLTRVVLRAISAEPLHIRTDSQKLAAALGHEAI